MKKQPKAKMKKPKRRTGYPPLQPAVRINQEVIEIFVAMIDARKRVIPPDIRAEFERLETLPEGRPTPEQEAWMDEVLRLHKPSEETVQLCLAELRLACESAQFELDLQPEAKPGRQKYRRSASQVERSIGDSLMFALANVAQLYGVRETMPPDARAEFDRIDQLSQEDVTPEDDAWIEAARETYAPSKEVFQRHMVRLSRMCDIKRRGVRPEVRTPPAPEP